MARAQSLVEQRVFRAEAVLTRQLSGQRVLTGLLDAFASIVDALDACGWKIDALEGPEGALARLLGPHLQGVSSRYQAWLSVTDRLVALTDRQALTLHRQLQGLAL